MILNETKRSVRHGRAVMYECCGIRKFSIIIIIKQLTITRQSCLMTWRLSQDNHVSWHDDYHEKIMSHDMTVIMRYLCESCFMTWRLYHEIIMSHDDLHETFMSHDMKTITRHSMISLVLFFKFPIRMFCHDKETQSPALINGSHVRYRKL